MNKEIKEQIIKLRREGLGYKKIAKELGANLNSIKSFCRANRLKASELDITNCKNCKAIIDKKIRRKSAVFCSDKCRVAWWNKNQDKLNRKKTISKKCPHCNKTFKSYKHENRKYCSHECYINKRFKGDK